MSITCKITMKDRVKPADGSVKGREGHETGTCPTCDTPGVMLSVVGGFVRKHVVSAAPAPENNPTLTLAPVRKTKAGETGPNKHVMDDGEILSVKHRLAPVAGTVREAVAGEFKGATIKHPDRAGECPLCRAFVPLSSKGFITGHPIGGGSAPASAELSQRSVIPADTGAQVGDPANAMQRRTVDLDGAFEAGTVMVPLPGPKGRPRLTEVEATEDNLRTALDYWRGKRPRSESGKAEQTAQVTALVRRLDALRQASVPVHADVDAPVTTDVATRQDPVHTSMGASVSPDGLTTPKGRGMITGAPLVQGRPITPFAGPVRISHVGDLPVKPAPARDPRTGYDAKAGTLAGPLGRTRLDREAATVAEPEPELSPSQKRRARRQRCDARWATQHATGSTKSKGKGKGKGKRAGK